MAAQKNIIKAGTLDMKASKIEKVNLSEKTFSRNVLKHVPVSENSVELEVPEIEQPSKEEKEIELESFYDDEGNLTGVRIKCKCGELIELEFYRD